MLKKKILIIFLKFCDILIGCLLKPAANGNLGKNKGKLFVMEDRHGCCDSCYFERPRLNDLFRVASAYPLVMVCAGAGYGKTSAVHDFTLEYKEPVPVWVQLSGRDNSGTRFWENYVHSMVQVNQSLARAFIKIGFPDTQDRMNQYISLLHKIVDQQRRIFVIDDFHLIEDPSVLHFFEYSSNYIPAGTSLFIISRSTPHLNTTGLISQGRQYNVNEKDLCFTENELAQFFNKLNIPPRQDTLREIMHDTGGWAFAINLIARSYQKAPGYEGYVRNAMKTNVFQLIETEIWDAVSKKLQVFLICLSLIDHLSVDLISLLANGDEELIDEMERQNAYVRRDSYINAYIIHPLFREFLGKKQCLLSADQKHETYRVTGGWCMKNGFKIDAMSYYEKIGDYESLVAIFLELPAQIPLDIATYLAAILDRAPENAFDTVETLATLHLRSYICQGLSEKAIELAEHYEKKLLMLPKNHILRKRTLGGIYHCWAILRGMLCLTDDRYDFDHYYKKFVDCYSGLPESVHMHIYTPEHWIIRVGTSRKGAPEEYIKALTRTVECVSSRFGGRMDGEVELAHGVLNFFRGNIQEAELCITQALSQSRESKQFSLIHRELFFLLRIAVFQGDYQKAEQAVRDMKTQLDYHEYTNRHITYNILLSWYYYVLGLPEKISDWLKGNFSPYSHAGFIENFANQVKARYCYMTRNYPPLLSYIQEMKQRESYLFGRVELLAIEACVHYKMKDRGKAFAAFEEAYRTTDPNGIVMPFIELGKDMRTLTSAALKEPGIDIPPAWLENINHRSATFAKHQSNVIMEYRRANSLADNFVFSQRQEEILADLSRADIASNRKLSENTVKMIITSLYNKLGAKNRADFIRIAVQRKVI